jgi:nitrate reductase cytochrome c-type subunit
MYSERRREVKYIYSPSFIEAEIKEYVCKSQINKCITEEYNRLSYDTGKEEEYIH